MPAVPIAATEMERTFEQSSVSALLISKEKTVHFASMIPTHTRTLPKYTVLDAKQMKKLK